MEDAVKLKKQLMRTRIVVIVLSILSVLFILFAYVQKLEANEQRIIAIEFSEVSEKWMAEAERQEKLARQNEMIAKQNEITAAKALEECQKKKQ